MNWQNHSRNENGFQRCPGFWLCKRELFHLRTSHVRWEEWKTSFVWLGYMELLEFISSSVLCCGPVACRQDTEVCNRVLLIGIVIRTDQAVNLGTRLGLELMCGENPKNASRSVLVTLYSRMAFLPPAAACSVFLQWVRQRQLLVCPLCEWAPWSLDYLPSCIAVFRPVYPSHLIFAFIIHSFGVIFKISLSKPYRLWFPAIWKCYF